jgi:hypothetical protein
MRRDLAILILSTAISFPLGLLIGEPWLLPVLNAIPAYLVLVHRLRKGERGGAVRAMLWWALTLALVGTTALALWPFPSTPVVLHGPAYRAGMFQWIRTGIGAEGSPRLFMPRHLAHLAVFVALSLATASALSTVAGAIVMNDMSFYVASLHRAGVPDLAVVLLGWQPWAISRVAAYCTLGAVLAEPLLFRLFPGARARLKVIGRRPYFIGALTGLMVDWALKAALAPLWGRWLRSLLP